MLVSIEKTTELIDDAWIAVHVPGQLVQMGKHVHRALKILTECEAHQVVETVAGNNGFEAWKSLHMRFGQSAASKQGQVVGDVTAMAKTSAKSRAAKRSSTTTSQTLHRRKLRNLSFPSPTKPRSTRMPNTGRHFGKTLRHTTRHLSE